MRAVKTLTGVLVLGLVLAGATQAQRIQVGKLFVGTTTKITPRTLPIDGYAPVKMLNSTSISMADGALPPQLRKLVLKFDRNGRIATRGLGVCAPARLRDATPLQARRRCARAVVGKGEGLAVTEAGTKIASALTLFNGPRRHGNPVVIAHGYDGDLSPTSVVVPMEIHKLRKGPFGFRVAAEIPPIADGLGSVRLIKMTVGRTWRRNGRKFSFLSARCMGGTLQTRGSLSFADGSFMPGWIIQGCRTRRRGR